MYQFFKIAEGYSESCREKDNEDSVKSESSGLRHSWEEESYEDSWVQMKEEEEQQGTSSAVGDNQDQEEFAQKTNIFHNSFVKDRPKKEEMIASSASGQKRQQKEETPLQNSQSIALKKEYPKIMPLHGKIKLRKRLKQYLKEIMSHKQPLTFNEIFQILRNTVRIPWERQQLNHQNVSRFINNDPELKNLYDYMLLKIQSPQLQIENLEPPLPQVTKYCKKILSLLQNRKENHMYFLWQSEFPTDFFQDKGKNTSKIIFRGVLGSNNLSFWDLLDVNESQENSAKSLKFIIDLILKRKTYTKVYKYLVLSKRFINLYQSTVEQAFQAGFNLIGFPSDASSLNPVSFWLRTMRDHAKKFKINSLQNLKLFLHYEGSRLFDKQAIADYIFMSKRFMMAEIKKDIEVGFSQSIK